MLYEFSARSKKDVRSSKGVRSKKDVRSSKGVRFRKMEMKQQYTTKEECKLKHKETEWSKLTSSTT